MFRIGFRESLSLRVLIIQVFKTFRNDEEATGLGNRAAGWSKKRKRVVL